MEQLIPEWIYVTSSWEVPIEAAVYGVPEKRASAERYSLSFKNTDFYTETAHEALKTFRPDYHLTSPMCYLKS